MVIELNPVWQWFPGRRVTWGREGEVSKCEVTPRFLGEDQRIKWGSTPPGYRFSYFWADKVNFESWLGRVLEDPAKA